ncbi:MAG: radical SAM protein, partial [Bacteroidota bacterium]
MAGIYLHIPFCKQACHYCDFHFTTSLKRKAELLEILEQEIALRKDYLNQQEVASVYLGGGTPSLLNAG